MVLVGELMKTKEKRGKREAKKKSQLIDSMEWRTK